MLVLKRRKGESIVIGEGADATEVTVLRTDGGRVYLGVDAKEHVPVWRKEMLGEDGQLPAPRKTVRVRYRDVGPLPPMCLEDEAGRNP